MGWKEPFEKVPCFRISKRLGRPQLFGHIIFGWSLFGEDNEACVVYQQRRRRLGVWRWGEPITTPPENFYQAPTWPVHPGTPAQNIQTGKFRDAISSWQSLTAKQKNIYNQLGKKNNRTGYHIYISQYLRSH